LFTAFSGWRCECAEYYGINFVHAFNAPKSIAHNDRQYPGDQFNVQHGYAIEPNLRQPDVFNGAPGKLQHGYVGKFGACYEQLRYNHDNDHGYVQHDYRHPDARQAGEGL